MMGRPGRNAEARARKQGATVVEFIDINVVWRRDGGICWLCEKPVDLALRQPDPRIATIDHVKALSKGGQHVYSNVRLAHRNCNARRGNPDLV
jgi:HNH endonuclease